MSGLVLALRLLNAWLAGGNAVGFLIATSEGAPRPTRIVSGVAAVVCTIAAIL